MVRNCKKFILVNQTLILRFFVLIVLIWLSIGFFPILNIEGDSSLFSAGCERQWRNGIILPPDYFYAWDMQPLAGIIVVAIKYALPFFSSEQIYSVLTLLSSIIYLFICSFFISKISKIRWEYSFLILILFPESYSIAYYPNTTILASVVSLLGFLLILNKSLNLISIFLLGLAPLFRVDVIAIYPVVFLLFWIHFDLKKSLFLSTLYALCVLLISSIGFLLLKANPFETLNGYQSLSNQKTIAFDIVSFLKINITFYTIPILILMAYGIFSLFKLNQYKLLALSTLPIAILYLIYKDFSGAAPKHIQYLLPFAGIICVSALKQIRTQIANKKYAFIYILGFALFIQYFLGIRFDPLAKPWLMKIYSSQFPRPTVTTLASFQINQGKVEIVLGSGQIIPTADEFMLISGNFFAPLYWHEMKVDEQKERAVLNDIVSKITDTIFFMTTQASDWPFSQQMHNMGFEIQTIDQKVFNTSLSSELYFKKGTKIIHVNRIYIERKADSFDSAFVSVSHRPLYIMTLWDWQMYFINEGKTIAEPISDQFSVVRY